LLDRFYKDRTIPFATRLIVIPRGHGVARLTNQGADIQDIRPRRAASRELRLYRKEMSRFTSFLADEFSRPI
jgi:hypothetical protein